MQERSAGLVLKRGNLYLILHYEAGHWDFPKGKLEDGETEEQAAIRELEEETGISDANLNTTFRETIVYFFQRKDETIKKSVVFFVGTTKKEEVILSHEHQGYEWLSFDAAMERVTFENAKEVLKKAHAFFEQ